MSVVVLEMISKIFQNGIVTISIRIYRFHEISIQLHSTWIFCFRIECNIEFLSMRKNKYEQQLFQKQIGQSTYKLCSILGLR